MLKKLVIVFILVTLIFVSCSLFMDDAVPVSAEVTFEDRDESSQLNVSRSHDTLAPRALSPTESLAPIKEFYGLLGAKVGSYTPTEFRLWIQDMVFFNEELFTALDVDVSVSSVTDPSPHYADFVNEVVIRPDKDILSGTYTGMLFLFFTGNQSLNADNYSVQISPSITVNIPDYAGVWVDKTDSNTGRYDIEGLGGGTYKMVPNILLPNNWTADTGSATGNQRVTLPEGSGTIQRLEMFAYISGSEYRAILPGIEGHPATWSPSEADTMGIPNYGASGNWSAVIMPFAGVTIPTDAQGISLSVQWDLDGIVEVYDHGTPADKSDDIMVLADNFWERFSLVPTIVY